MKIHDNKLPPEFLNLLRQEITKAVKSALSITDHEDRLVDANEAARLLGMTVLAVRKAKERGALPSVRIGNRVRFKVSDLLATAGVRLNKAP